MCNDLFNVILVVAGPGSDAADAGQVPEHVRQGHQQEYPFAISVMNIHILFPETSDIIVTLAALMSFFLLFPRCKGRCKSLATLLYGPYYFLPLLPIVWPFLRCCMPFEGLFSGFNFFSYIINSPFSLPWLFS